jgi:hypothetical protein
MTTAYCVWCARALRARVTGGCAQALSEEGTVLDGAAIAVAVESRAETAVLVGVPYEASTDYVRLLFSQCGDVAHIHEFSKTKYKICKYRQLFVNLFILKLAQYMLMLTKMHLSLKGLLKTT